MKKSRRMREVEERLGKPLEEVLPRLLSEKGFAQTASELGVSKATVGYWLLKLGLNARRVYLQPGDKLVIRKASRSEE